ncbi:ribosome biogenesis protein SSF1 [Usnea florida]
MARRRTKKRTHVGAHTRPANRATANSSATREPKSMVIRIGAGEVGPRVSQLVKDVRSVMEPGTASRLKERRSNRLRDYTAMAGPLGVSHLLLFSRSSTGNTNLRLALTPRGPTLHFRVEDYTLCKDVRKAQKRPQGGGKEYMTAPLLVMNNFISPTADGSQPTVPKHLESLTTTIFQSLFPPISPQSTPLSSIHRVLLLNRELPETLPTSNASGSIVKQNGAYVLKFRHYAITTRRTGLSRGINRLNAAEKTLKPNRKSKRGLPNLGKLEDVADYLLDPSATADGGFTSASETEVETDAEVEVLEPNTRKVLNKKQMAVMRNRSADGKPHPTGRPNVEKRAVKLVELGPRMALRMTKVEEGVCEGKVMWHESIEKTAEEVKEMEQIWDTRRKEKAERKRVQKENVLRKRNEKGARSKKANGEDRHKKDGEQEEEEAADDDVDMYEDEWDSEGLEGDAEMEINERDEG